MDFSFTQEQRMIRDTAEAFYSQVSSSDAVRDVMQTESGFDESLWQSTCQDMYFQAINIPEEFGGLGLGYVELCSVMEQAGKHLACSPLFSTTCLATSAILFGATQQQKALYFPKIIDGVTATFAYAGQHVGTSASWQEDCIELTYQQVGEQFVLEGDCHFVINGHTAQLIIVAAKEKTTSVLSLFILDSNAIDSGLSRDYTPSMDQTQKLARLNFNNLAVSKQALMVSGDDALKVLSTTLALAQITMSAEQLGGSQSVLEQSVSYVNERVQFNRPVGSFQSIKHKAADMMLKTEASRSAVYYAACVADNMAAGIGELEQLQEAANIAKGYSSDAYFFNAGCAIQMHGGVGFTWEYDVHLYFKRAQSSANMFGNTSYHYEQIAARLLD